MGKRKDETIDHVRNVDIWKEAQLPDGGIPQREEVDMAWACVQRRDKDDAKRKILQMTVDGKRNRGRPTLRWRDLMKEDNGQKPDGD